MITAGKVDGIPLRFNSAKPVAFVFRENSDKTTLILVSGTITSNQNGYFISFGKPNFTCPNSLLRIKGIGFIK